MNRAGMVAPLIDLVHREPVAAHHGATTSGEKMTDIPHKGPVDQPGHPALEQHHTHTADPPEPPAPF